MGLNTVINLNRFINKPRLGLIGEHLNHVIFFFTNNVPKLILAPSSSLTAAARMLCALLPVNVCGIFCSVKVAFADASSVVVGLFLNEDHLRSVWVCVSAAATFKVREAFAPVR